MTPARLRITGLRKSFDGVQALRGVSLEVGPGEVHALIGENGAGKSTLMKALSGALQADAGEMFLDGEAYTPRNPLDARRCGIAMIYQELNLAPHLSVEENILLGSEPARFGFVKRKARREKAREALAQVNHAGLPLDAPVNQLSIAEQQMVEIARALISTPKVLIMDEPTSSLTQVDTENLFAAIKRLHERGVSIIYISHFLEECLRLASRFTVLRDGETVGSGEMKSGALPEIIRLMVGRDIKDVYPRVPHAIGEPVLEVRGLRGIKKPKSVDFTVRRGEILGIAGLVGAGRTEALRVLFGLDDGSGEVKVHQKPAGRASPAVRLAEGIGLLSENRKEEGLMLNRTIADNLTLSKLRPCSSAGMVRAGRQQELTKSWMQRLDVRAQGPQQLIGNLSGGNQQKVAIGRLLHHEADVLLLDEPTRGIDVASKSQIYHLIGELAQSGKAVVFVSSYLPELLGVCDTIAVMCRGVICATRPAAEWTEHSIIATAIGQSEEGHAGR
ncbi:MAG TPA: sugar ABC transporter ATP-binding protein [Verrucomicrobiae bacterium]|nr:sugar ABC transporter ATP-binding protein [Verrucomicrobiae bacterium]